MSKIDLDKILDGARAQFKNKDEALGNQIIKGSDVYVPSKPEDFIYWPNSAWHMMTGAPGLPFGRVVQVAGRPDSGKSTHAMQFLKLTQEQGYIPCLWDTEGKWSSSRFDNKFGGSSEDLLIVNSRVILEGADMIQALVRSALGSDPEAKMLVVWDSVGGTIAKSEKEKSLRESNQMAEAAKNNGKAIRGFVRLMEEFRNPDTGQHRLAVLLINQTYASINAMVPSQVESGGQKVEFFSSLILQLTRKTDLFRVRDKVKRKMGISTRARVKKNHLFGDGEDTIAEMVLDITAGGIAINKKDPAAALLPDFVSANDLQEDPEVA